MQLFSENHLDGVTSKLWEADALAMLKSLKRGSVDLIVTSPPYFIGKEYDTSRSVQDFSAEIRRITKEMVRVLRPGGSLCWQVGNHVKDGALIPLDVIIGGELLKQKDLVLRNRIIWTFNHGAHASVRFSGRHETILWYTKGSVAHFDLNRVRVPQTYPGKRHYKGPKKGEWSGNPLGKNPGDVWDIGDVWGIPNVKANHIEKTEHPCQFPTALVRRLIVALAPRGGIVVDPYAGSATTGVASLLEGRAFIGSDIDRKYLQIGSDRLAKLENGTLGIREDVPVHVPSGRESVATAPPHFAMLQLRGVNG
jgi:adenine-specific DNA-methyltransferase